MAGLGTLRVVEKGRRQRRDRGLGRAMVVRRVLWRVGEVLVVVEKKGVDEVPV